GRVAGGWDGAAGKGGLGWGEWPPAKNFLAPRGAAGPRAGGPGVSGIHPFYGPRGAARLLSEADRRGVVPVTTEKDLARMSDNPALAALATRVKSLPVALVLDDEAEFHRLMLRGTGTQTAQIGNRTSR